MVSDIFLRPRQCLGNIKEARLLCNSEVYLKTPIIMCIKICKQQIPAAYIDIYKYETFWLVTCNVIEIKIT